MASSVYEHQEIFLAEESETWPLFGLVCLFIVASLVLLMGMGWGMSGQLNGMLAVTVVGLIPMLRVIFKDDFSR
jgi:hypothetical protein